MRPSSNDRLLPSGKLSCASSKPFTLRSAEVFSLGLSKIQTAVFVVLSKLWYMPVCRIDHGSAPSIRPLFSGYFKTKAISTR